MTRLRLLIGFILLALASPAGAQFSGGGGSGSGSGSGGYTGSSDIASVSVTTATNPSTETALKELTLPVGLLNTAGRKIFTHASGRYTTAAAQTPTLRYRWYLCTVSGCGSGTVVTLMDFTTAATTASTTNSWKLEGHIGTATAGATGTVESKFAQQVQLGSAGNLTPETRLDQNNAVSSAIDLTGALYLRLTVLASSADAGNSVTQRMGYIDGGGGAPTSSTYLTQTCDTVLSAEQCLSGLATGLIKNTNGTGIISIAAAGTDYVAPAGNAATASALAANGANCSAGSAPLGVDASGAAETCTDYAEEPASNGIIAKTGANTTAARTDTGTANQIDITNGNGVAGNPTFALSSTLVIPGPGIEFTETAGDSTCAAGNYWIKANSTTGGFRKCQNGTATDLDTGGGGSLTGTVGTTDNAVVRADGTGGSTAQGSLVTIDDTGKVTAPGGFEATGGTGTWSMLEGTSPGAGASAGLHNLFFFTDSKLHSHENGGVDVTYTRTADNLSVFAATTSAELAGVLSDETGSGGGIVRATSPTLTTPTITTPTFSGTAPTLADGITWTFNPSGTSAGLNVGSQAGLVGTPNNGDIWYDSTGNKYKCRENGVTVDCISTGAGTGDITDVVAGAGVTVATPGGPAPTVTWDASTFVNNVTMWNAANASRTWTANLSGATDPVLTFSDATVNVSTGSLQVGGVDVVTASSTATLTNKTLDAEGTGNSLTIPRRIWFPAAGCVNATAGSVWDLPTSAPAVAACVTGTNTQKGVLDFADASDLSAQLTYALPSTWTGAIDAKVKWFSGTTTGDVVWQVQTICVADAETDDPAFNTASTVTDTAKGTTNQLNDASITGITATGCSAGELLHLKIRRDAGHVSDTHAATARLVGVELVIREAM